jgi:hypothetical protein
MAKLKIDGDNVAIFDCDCGAVHKITIPEEGDPTIETTPAPEPQPEPTPKRKSGFFGSPHHG